MAHLVTHVLVCSSAKYTGDDGQILTHFRVVATDVEYASRYNEPEHVATHDIVDACAYKSGIEGHTFTHVLVDGSLNRLAVVLQLVSHFRDVLSA